jgi:uncharacterized phage-like protein YoqJ
MTYTLLQQGCGATVYAFTGHRPSKLGGYGYTSVERLYRFAIQTLKSCCTHNPVIISGMALGWDQAVAMAGIHLGMPVIAAVPCLGQDSQWPDLSQHRYDQILSKCSIVHLCSVSKYDPSKMHLRNRWMVDSCNKLVALWDGTHGGTAGCVQYATHRKVDILNVWDQWSVFEDNARTAS